MFSRKPTETGSVVTTTSAGGLPSLLTAPGKTKPAMNTLNEAAGFDLGHKRWTMPETGASNEFLDVVIATIQSLRTTGTLKSISGYDHLAEIVSSQMTVLEALRKLLWKRKLAVEEGTPKIWFGIADTDPLAPLVQALIEVHAHKALPDVATADVRSFKVGFAVEHKAPPKKKEAQVAGPETDNFAAS